MTRGPSLRSIRDPLLARRLTRVWRQVSARLDAVERAKPHSARGAVRRWQQAVPLSQGDPVDRYLRARGIELAKLRQPGGAAAETPEYCPVRPATTLSSRPAPCAPVPAPPRRKLIDLSAVPSSMEQRADEWGEK